MTPRLAPNLTLALLQLVPCRTAQAQGADVALFPEIRHLSGLPRPGIPA